MHHFHVMRQNFFPQHWQQFWETAKQQTYIRRKIILIESNAKCRHLKYLPVKGLCGRCLRPPPLLGYSLGWSSNVVGSELGQIPSVKLLQNMVSNRNQHPPPPPSHSLSVYPVL